MCNRNEIIFISISKKPSYEKNIPLNQLKWHRYNKNRENFEFLHPKSMLYHHSNILTTKNEKNRFLKLIIRMQSMKPIFSVWFWKVLKKRNQSNVNDAFMKGLTPEMLFMHQKAKICPKWNGYYVTKIKDLYFKHRRGKLIPHLKNNYQK